MNCWYMFFCFKYRLHLFPSRPEKAIDQFLISLLLKFAGMLTEAVQLNNEPVRKSFAPRPNDDADCDDDDDDEN